MNCWLEFSFFFVYKLFSSQILVVIVQETNSVNKISPSHRDIFNLIVWVKVD